MADKAVIFAKTGKAARKTYGLVPTIPGLFEFPFMKGGGTPMHERLAKLWEGVTTARRSARPSAAIPRRSCASCRGANRWCLKTGASVRGKSSLIKNSRYLAVTNAPVA